MNGAGILDRALGIFGAFSEDDPELTAAQLAERTGLPHSTLHRLLSTLIEHGLIVRLPDARYTVGSRLWELGELSPLSLRLRERSLPNLLRLYEATGENVHLGVLDGNSPDRSSVLYVGRVTGRRSSPTVSRAGGRGPLHATGVGKALLAGREEVWLRQYFRGTRELETRHTVVDEAELRAELDRARARGYASTREEMTLGTVSIAAAFPLLPGLPPVALGLVVDLARADEKRLAALVQQSARDIVAVLREP